MYGKCCKSYTWVTNTFLASCYTRLVPLHSSFQITLDSNHPWYLIKNSKTSYSKRTGPMTLSLNHSWYFVKEIVNFHSQKEWTDYNRLVTLFSTVNSEDNLFIHVSYYEWSDALRITLSLSLNTICSLLGTIEQRLRLRNISISVTFTGI